MQVFVDDPWLALLGSTSQTDRMIAVIIVVWRILGVSLAFAKGQLGDTVNWIGATLSIESSKTLAITIIRDRLAELRELCAVILSANKVSVRCLRTFTGKCQSMASILHAWRPL